MVNIESLFEILKTHIWDISIVIGIILSLFVGWIVCYFILKKFFEKSKKDVSKFTKILNTFNRAAFIFLFVIGLKAGLDYTEITGMYQTEVNSIFIIIGVFVGSFLAIKVLISVTENYMKKRIGVGNAYLLQKLGKIIIIILSVIIALYLFEIEVSPILAGLGIAGLAIAFALQDTLSNFFSGIYLTADQPIRPGDYIEVGQDIKGTVVDISWRSTRISTFDGNTIIIPNKKLGESTITNYNLPKRELINIVKIDAAYGSDPEKVEKVIRETAKKIVEKTDGCMKSYEPVVRLYELGDFGLKFLVLFKTKTRIAKFGAEHELRKALYKAFKKNKIEIPFPTSTVHVKK